MGIRQFALTRKALYNKNSRKGTYGSGEDYVCVGVFPPKRSYRKRSLPTVIILIAGISEPRRGRLRDTLAATLYCMIVACRTRCVRKNKHATPTVSIMQG